MVVSIGMQRGFICLFLQIRGFDRVRISGRLPNIIRRLLVTKLTLETDDRTVLILVKEEGIDLDTLMQDLVKPIVLAAGYSPENVNDYISNN